MFESACMMCIYVRGETMTDARRWIQKAIGEKEGLSEMLESARQEEPLAGWGGIRVVTEEDM